MTYIGLQLHFPASFSFLVGIYEKKKPITINHPLNKAHETDVSFNRDLQGDKSRLYRILKLLTVIESVWPLSHVHCYPEHF